MAEDQGANGDRWTEQASKLLCELGWDKIADSNIDVEGSDGLMHGIDSLFRYNDAYTNVPQGVFVEAKRYRTTSFRESKIQDWITVLNNKMIDLRRSDNFNFTYPAIADTNPQNGLLIMWFHDHQNYSSIQGKLITAQRAVRLPKSYKSVSNRLFVLSNDEILRLAALVDTKQKWESDNQEYLIKGLKYYYPSSIARNSPTHELENLTFEYIYSRFIVARATERRDNIPKSIYLIFYFGSLDMRSFASLKQALLSHNMISDDDCKIHLYCYQRDPDFRKIRPDIETMFRLTDSTQFSIQSMTHLADLPGWMDESAM